MKQVRIARKNLKTGEVDSSSKFGEANDFNIRWLQKQVDSNNQKYGNFGYEWFLQYENATTPLQSQSTAK